MTSSNVRRIAAALMFAPLAACAAPLVADQSPAVQQAASAPAPQQAAPEAAAPIPVPAPASQDIQPLPRGATTADRPASPARPAPSGPVSTPVQSPGPAAVEAAPAAEAPAVTMPVPGQRPPQVAMPGSNAPAPGSLLQTILALVLVLGLLLGLAWFMKRYGPRAMGASANVKLVGALNIGGRERIMVVEVGNQWIVVGASPGRVNALATMPRQEGAHGDGQATLAAQPPAAGSFGDWLKNTVDKRNAK